MYEYIMVKRLLLSYDPDLFGGQWDFSKGTINNNLTNKPTNEKTTVVYW